MSYFVIRQIHPPNLSALANEATMFNLASAAIRNEVVKGAYLQWSDPDALGGRGDDRWTDDLALAKRFASHDAAFECWRAQSKKVPWRPDGRPNRPMTAYSVTIEEVKE